MLLVLASTILSTVLGCAYIAIQSAPKKVASTTRKPLSNHADELFWRTLHEGNYDGIPEVLFKLKAAYVEDPNDWQIAAHIAWTHLWRLAERRRFAKISPEIIDDATLSLKYFEEAHRLNPSDTRLLGFIASLKMAVGAIDNNERLTREGYFEGLTSIKKWPEFNHFTVGYVMTDMPHDRDRFKESLLWTWNNADACLNTKLDRNNPSFAPYMSLEESQKEIRKKSVCWNSTIAPHNFEGFFLNFGDLLVKSGDVKTAKIIYENAKLSKSYDTWAYKPVLEERLKNLEQNIIAFRVETKPNEKAQKPIMFRSEFSCVACHQQ